MGTSRCPGRGPVMMLVRYWWGLDGSDGTGLSVYIWTLVTDLWMCSHPQLRPPPSLFGPPAIVNLLFMISTLLSLSPLFFFFQFWSSVRPQSAVSIDNKRLRLIATVHCSDFSHRSQKKYMTLASSCTCFCLAVTQLCPVSSPSKDIRWDYLTVETEIKHYKEPAVTLNPK